MSYSVVQKTLEQTIARKDLEEASVHVPSVARGDCARLHRDLFGIVTSGLSHDEAIAFQVALEHFHFPTDIVPDSEIPRLPEPVIRRGIRFSAEELIALDGLGRESRYSWKEVQLAVGGFLETNKVNYEHTFIRNPYHSSAVRAQITPMFILGKNETEEAVQEFRLDLFLSCEPHRLQFRAGEDTLFRCDDAILRFHQREAFDEILRKIARIVPIEKQGLGMKATYKGLAFLYPNPSTFEEESTWHLLQQLRR